MTRKASLAAERSRIDPSAPSSDDEKNPAVPLQLIIRLAAQDPTVQLKIGMVEQASDGLPIDEEEKPKTGQ